MSYWDLRLDGLVILGSTKYGRVNAVCRRWAGSLALINVGFASNGWMDRKNKSLILQRWSGLGGQCVRRTMGSYVISSVRGNIGNILCVDFDNYDIYEILCAYFVILLYRLPN